VSETASKVSAVVLLIRRLAETPPEKAIVRPEDGLGNVPLWEM
jgi:hypothetical protein